MWTAGIMETAKANKKRRKHSRLANAASCKIGDFPSFKSIGKNLNPKKCLRDLSVRALPVEMEARLIYGE